MTSAGLLRKLLLDSPTLVDVVNRERRLDITYVINAMEPAWKLFGDIPLAYAIEDGFDPRTSLASAWSRNSLAWPGRGQGSPRETLRSAPRRQSKPERRTLTPVRTVLNPLGFLLAGLAIGYVLAPSLNRLTPRDGPNEIAVDFPPGSEAERQWRVRVSGLEGTSRTAL